MVQVPMGGDLNRMVMLLLTGERIVVIFEAFMGAGYWQFESVRHRRKTKAEARPLMEARRGCY